MRVDDIERDLDTRDLTVIEDAFRALVADEDEIEPMYAVADAADLLARVCNALQSDRRVMPGQVVGTIRDETNGALTDATYAAGAAAVKAHIGRWRVRSEAMP